MLMPIGPVQIPPQNQDQHQISPADIVASLTIQPKQFSLDTILLIAILAILLFKK